MLVAKVDNLMTKISIITINYNNAKGLQRTVESVVSQNHPALEYLVIDGGSTDKSLSVIEKFASKISYWVSEKDSGVYNAQNKGIQKATGDYVLLLNSGDYFHTAHAITRLIENSKGQEIIYGDMIVKSGDKEEVNIFPDTLDFTFFVDNYIPHPCTLISRKLFSRVGLYKEEYRICADWVFFIEAIGKFNATYHHVSEVISVFETGGLSSNPASGMAEKEVFLKKEYGFCYDGYRDLYNYRERIAELRRSRLVRLVFTFLPARLKEQLGNRKD